MSLRKTRPTIVMLARRLVPASAALIGVALIGGGIMMVAPGSSSLASTAPAAYVPDMNELLDARSPGSRRYGWLVNTKPQRIGDAADDPVERVLPSIRRRSPAAVTSEAVPLAGFPVPPDGAAALIAPAGGLIPIGEANPLSGVGGLAGPVTGGGSLPGVGGGVGGNTSTPGQDPSLSAVPEPSAWTLMILGFGMLGVFLRKRRPLYLASDPR